MQLEINKQGKAVVIELAGSLLAETQSNDVLELVTRHIKEGDLYFVFNLGDLKFINSAGLGMLLTCLTKARKAGGDVILCQITEQLKHLLVITKLSAIFTNAENMDEAMNLIK